MDTCGRYGFLQAERRFLYYNFKGFASLTLLFLYDTPKPCVSGIYWTRPVTTTNLDVNSTCITSGPVIIWLPLTYTTTGLFYELILFIYFTKSYLLRVYCIINCSQIIHHKFSLEILNLKYLKYLV